MYKCFVWTALICFGAVCSFSCSSANNKPFSVRFSADSSSIVFSGVDPAGLLVIRNTPAADTSSAGMITVLEMPAVNDTTGMERQVSGQVSATDSTVVFKPLKAFVKGRSYQVLSFLNVKFADKKMIFTSQMSQNVKPRVVVLER